MLTWNRRSARWQRLQRAFVWLLLASVPAFGLSETLTQLLGPRHCHEGVAEHSQWERHTHEHEHEHEGEDEHEDDSVVLIDPIAADDGASAEPAASVWALGAALQQALPNPRTLAWPLGHAAAFCSRVAGMPDRPPKR